MDITENIYLRHNGRIGHAEMSDSINPQSIIDHGHGIVRRSHLAGARLMILRTGVLTHCARPIVLARERISGTRG